jgi:hypothetical protein
MQSPAEIQVPSDRYQEHLATSLPPPLHCCCCLWRPFLTMCLSNLQRNMGILQSEHSKVYSSQAIKIVNHAQLLIYYIGRYHFVWVCYIVIMLLPACCLRYSQSSAKSFPNALEMSLAVFSPILGTPSPYNNLDHPNEYLLNHVAIL